MNRLAVSQGKKETLSYDSYTFGEPAVPVTRAYVADAGVNLLFTSFWYKFQVEVDREVSGPNETSVVYGPLCMNIDALDDGVALPPLGT